MQETGPSVYRPFSRSFERLSICKFLEKPAYFKTLSVGLVWGFSPDPPVQQSRLSEDVIKSRDQGDWNLAPHAHFSNDLRKVLRCQSQVFGNCGNIFCPHMLLEVNVDGVCLRLMKASHFISFSRL